ncbi:MAG TPA: NnrU family protein, partial [Steroidobacteraceae bacterium]
GERGWKGLYALISAAGIVLICYGFSVARREPVVLYSPPLWLHHLTLLLMIPVFPLLLAAYLPGRIKAAVKHPMLLAVKIWALAHLLANGTLADVLLFGGFLIWAGADRMSVKRRAVQAPVPGAPPRPWNDAVAVIAGLALYALTVTWLHFKLFGVSPLAMIAT